MDENEYTEPEMKVLVIHESVLASMIKDLFSIGMIIAVMYANYLWGDANWVVNAFAVILSLIMLFSKTGANTYEIVSIGDLRAFIKAVDNENAERIRDGSTYD